MIIAPRSYATFTSSTGGTTGAGSAGGTTGSTNTSGTSGNSTDVAGPGGPMGKNEFLKLLVAQLQNQDPLSPMQGDQMAAQLAQFSSLEQLQDINSTLTDQSASQGSLLGAIQSGAAINTIGHNVVAIGDQVQVGANGANSVTADIAAAGAGTLHIYNSAGVEVGKRSLGNVAAGSKQTFALGDAAKGLGDGTYTYSIDVKDASGAAVNVQTYMGGRVDGISTSPTGLVLTSGGLIIPYASVVQVLN